ncbi:amiloride-sensitive sodium channel subunit alpha-like isoform X2 [Acanthaster planci]|nr:amiloride-sensitive sodium channel subunit alpha-like isoform X2 [Acanthaster planci]XP_022111142.1 amiloride-sensitive sodium channel subunit alpha-like isoform X2 [Acanthaster planci]
MTVEDISAEDGAAPAAPPDPAASAKQTSLLYVVSHRLAESGAHGIPNIQRANSNFRRVAWTLLFLAGFGMFIYQGCDLIIKFYKWPYNVNIEVRTPKRVEFPAVTWCNLNPIRKDALADFTDLRSLLEGGSSSCGTAVNATFGGYPGDWESADIDYELEDCTSQTVDAAIDIVGAMPYQERAVTGHRLNDMLLMCTFQQKPCSPKNFTSFYNSRYGNCFTFNSASRGVAPLKVTRTGPSYGLSMELYIQQDRYITGVETGAGIRIMVHNQTEMAFPEDIGANIAPGTESFLGLYRAMVNRLSDPYGDCATDFTQDNIFKEQFKRLEYTKEACEKDCFFRAVLLDCNCAYINYRYNDSQAPCNSSVKAVKTCIEKVENNFTSGELRCGHCHKSCNETRYQISFSNSKWPNREYMETVRKNIQESNKETISLIKNNSYFIEDNVLRVNVYFDSLNYDDIFQTAAYTLGSLVSDLGGQVGLWIGVSVLTLFEFLELMIDIFVLISTRCRAGGENRRIGKTGQENSRPQA